MSAIKDIEHFLSIQSQKVEKGVTIVDNRTLPCGLLHISTNSNIRKFIPVVSRRTGGTEDRSVSRISVAPSLIGCLIAYASAFHDFYDSKQKENKKDVKLLQEWTIYSFDTPYSLKPNTELLYDVKVTDEHWLVTYNKDTREYAPKKVGRCFYRDVLLIGRLNSYPKRQATIMIEITEGPVMLSKDIILTTGFWQLTCPEPSQHLENWKDTAEFVLKKVSKAEYTFLPDKKYTVSYEWFNW